MLRLIVLVLISVEALSAMKLGYKDAISHAISKSRKSHLIKEQVKVSGYNLLEAKTALTPIWSLAAGSDKMGALHASQKFTSGANADFNYDITSNSYAVSFKQPLLKGFNQAARDLSAAQAAFAQAKIGQIKSLQELVQDVLAAYWQVVSAQKNKRVQVLGRESSEKLYQQYKIKVAIGMLPKSSLVEKKGQVERFNLQMVQQNTAEKKARQTLNLLLNVPRDTKVILTGKLTLDTFGGLPDLMKVIAAVKKNNLDVISAKIAVAEAKRNYINAKNDLQPELDINANLANTGSSIGLALAMPLNNPSQQVKTAASALAQANITLDQVVQDKVKTVTNLWQDLQSKLVENKILRRNLQTSDKMLFITKKLYKLGRASSLDIITRQKTYVTDQQDIIANNIAYLQLYVRLMAEDGELLHYFGIVVK